MRPPQRQRRLVDGAGPFFGLARGGNRDVQAGWRDDGPRLQGDTVIGEESNSTTVTVRG